nr:hypothetical protein [Tanacetum cinerariifolium]
MMGMKVKGVEEVGIQLNAEQANWKDVTDDESNDQELEAHYMYMAKIQEVSPDAVDSGPIFDTEPEQKIDQNDEDVDLSKELDMNYDSEQIDQNDEDVDLSKERELLASLIEKLKCEIDESKNRNKFLETSNKRDHTDDELEDQELEAHYMYIAQIQKVSPDAADIGPIFDTEPVQK